MELVRNRVYRTLIIVLVLLSFTTVSLISKSAQSAIVDSQMILPGGKKSSLREMDEEKVRTTLENKIVAERLKSYGLSKEEVVEKMQRMSDEQVHQLAALSDRIPAGGDAWGFIIGALVVAVLILLIIYLARRV
ncbi:MAG TPA: PA2779 family protein [Thermodesulfobacteriota bacterium]|nr:PA2779 family protein [Thermodesulfobacteriota bacterium]